MNEDTAVYKHLSSTRGINASGQEHRVDTQPDVQLRVGTFDVCVLVFSAATIFLACVHGKCSRYIEDIDAVFTKKNSSLLTLERGR